MSLPADYFERVYAGVLGKMLGVYLGRPVEGWSYQRITETFGEITAYHSADRGWPLIIPDDDLSGTFLFLRALPEHGYRRDLTSHEIGETWLNQIVEGRTCLWWGGFGNSTEQTAYARLKAGVPAPQSGSAVLNGPVVAEEIGAQIFIDGWAMVAPGDPALAASLAREAARVSHDGEAVAAAVALAAMEAAAFTETDLERLLDVAQGTLPPGSCLQRLYRDIRAWHLQEPDWRRTRKLLEMHYGYDRFGGNVPVVPNHGLILLALLYGQGDLARSLMIASTCGWDTDCNAGNVGCLLGLRGGLAALESVTALRDPVADRLYLPGAEGGRAVTDALSVALEVTNMGRRLAGEPPLTLKGGARYHFELPGAVQGFSGTGAAVINAEGHSRYGSRSLAVHLSAGAGQTAWITVPTFLPPEAPEPPDVPFARGRGGGWNYTLLASPSLYSGQMVSAHIEADEHNAVPVELALGLHYYDADDQLQPLSGPVLQLTPGQRGTLQWRVPELHGLPVADIGVCCPNAAPGTWYLDTLHWQGAPRLTLGRPEGSGTMWRRAWVNAVERLDWQGEEPYRLLQSQGLGLLIQGAPEWTDYAVEAELRAPLARQFGLAVRVQGLRQHYSLMLVPGGAALFKTGPGGRRTLAERALTWTLGQPYRLRLEAVGRELRAFVDSELVLEVCDAAGPDAEVRLPGPLSCGGVALLIDEGWLSSSEVQVHPLPEAF